MDSEVQDRPTIHHLPDEMLLKLFEAMDPATLKESCLVCKKWNGMIGENLVMMKQLPLALEVGPWERILQNTKDFNRKFHTIKLDNISYWNVDALKVLSKNGTESRSLYISDCFIEIKHAKLFKKIFKLFTKLVELKLNRSTFFAFSKNDLKKVKPIALPELKYVVLNEGNLGILEVIKKSQLTSLKINGHDVFDEHEYLARFLAGQKTLQDLALRGIDLSFGEMSVDEVKEIPFHLKRLSLRWLNNAFRDEQKLIELLNKTAGTLEELELEGKFPDSVLELIFRKFLKLKVVSVDLKFWPTENVFYHNLRPNPSVRKLIVHGISFENQKSFEGLIGNLPNIDTLVMCASNKIPQPFMIFISNNLLKLNNFHFEFIDGQMFEHVRIHSVKFISVHKMENLSPKDWKSFVKAFPNVETFSVEIVDDKTSLNVRIFDIFTKGWSNLSHLKLGLGFIANKSIFKKLLSNCKLIKTVEMPKSAFEQKRESIQSKMLSNFKKDGLRLIIHEDDKIANIFTGGDKSLWTNEEAEIDFYDDDDSEESTGGENGFNWRLMEQILHAPLFVNDSSDDEGFLYYDSDDEMHAFNENLPVYYEDDNFEMD